MGKKSLDLQFLRGALFLAIIFWSAWHAAGQTAEAGAPSIPESATSVIGYGNSMVVADSPMLPERDTSRWLPIARSSITMPRGSRSFVAARVSSEPGDLNPAQPPFSLGASPPRPSLPEWTRCSSSYLQTLTEDPITGQMTWNFSTTLSLDDVQDLATSVRWYDDITAKYPMAAKSYAWVECAGFRVRDWRLNSAGRSPVDYFGAQGLDSPLGTCHSTTPAARHYEAACGEKDDASGCSSARALSTKLALGGVLEDDGKIHGLVRWSGDGLFYEGMIADVSCATGCGVEFDHPCSLPQPSAQPFMFRGPMQTNGKPSPVYTWWFGEDPRNPGPWAAAFTAAQP